MKLSFTIFPVGIVYWGLDCTLNVCPTLEVVVESFLDGIGAPANTGINRINVRIWARLVLNADLVLEICLVSSVIWGLGCRVTGLEVGSGTWV